MDFVNRLTLEKVILFFTGLFVFLLPWQTRYIISSGMLGSYPAEWLAVSIYGTEVLGWWIMVLFVFLKLTNPLLRAQFCKKLPFLLFLIPGFISVVLSSDPWVSFYFLLRVFLVVGLVWVISATAYRRVYYYTAFFLGGIFQALLALVQFVNQKVWASTLFGMARQSPGTLGVAVVETSLGRYLRAYGSFGWPNSLGIYLAVVFVVGLILLNSLTIRWQRLLVIVGELVVTVGLVLSFSRGAWLAALLGTVIFLGLNLWRAETRSVFVKRVGLVLGGSVVLIAGLVVLLNPLFSTRFTASDRLETRSISERTSQYHEALVLFKNSPWFGVGPGAYVVARQNFLLTDVAPQPVHNIFALILVEWGIIPCCIVVVASIFQRRRFCVISAGGWALLAVWIVAGLFDHWFTSLYSGLVCTAVILGLFFAEL